MTELAISEALKSANETQDILLGHYVLAKTGAMFNRLFPGKKVIVVADENTFNAAGNKVVSSLAQAGIKNEEPFIFPGTPILYASYANMEILREKIRPLTDTIVCSIAAGTLNDIVKLACGELKRPYLNVCTAASVDGYASFGASISREGFKITRDCPAPAGLIADLDVLCAAPKRLTATGYGDLIEKISAGADWILADELDIEKIDQHVWNLVQGDLNKALANPQQLAAANPQSIKNLMAGHIMSGLAMQAYKGSRPASGSGHHFSHVWEMEGHGLDWDPPLSHGFKVGIGTIAACAAWEETLKLDLTKLDVENIISRALSDEEIENKVKNTLIPRIAESAASQAVAKNLPPAKLEQRLLKIQSSWPTIKHRVSAQLWSADKVTESLKAVGAPYHPEMIGIDMDRFKQTHFKSQMIRNRYTLFDLLVDIGALEEIVEKLFSATGYWGQNSHPN